MANEPGESERPKIIINAKGEVKAVSPLNEEPPKESQAGAEKKKDQTQKPVDVENPYKEGAEAAVAGMVGYGINELIDYIRERTGNKETSQKKEESVDRLNFSEVESKLVSKNTSDEEKGQLLKRRSHLIDGFLGVDNGLFVREMRERVEKIVGENDWDTLHPALYKYAKDIENNLQGRGDIPKELDGIAMAAVEYEAHRALIAGLQHQRSGMSERAFKDWIRNKKKSQYTVEELNKIKEIADRGFVKLIPNPPEEFVGRSILVQTESVQQIQNEMEREVATLREQVAALTKILEDPKSARSGEPSFSGSGGIEDYLKRQTEITQRLLRKLEGADPDDEMQRWVDVEFDQEFYTRFTPNQEPRFYTLLRTEERREWNARWQLARAAFFKKNTASFPEKAKENSDLTGLSQEMQETLYNHEGVRQMLERYVEVLTNPDPLIGNRFWECKDQKEFEAFRSELREEIFGDSDSLKSKEADAIGWNLIYVYNLVESLDSRYSISGSRHGDLPSHMIADEYRTTLHPQERAETKWAAHHYTWGAFGSWGVTQLANVEKRKNYTGKDGWIFSPAPNPSFYWEARWTNQRTEKGGKKLEVFVPECYPTSQAGSFLEETTVVTPSSSGGKSLLDYLIDKEEIPWEEVANDASAIYVFGKFNKSVTMLDYFNPGSRPTYPPLEEKPSAPWAREWATPVKELFERLKPGKTIDKLRKSRKTYQTLHNFKIWLVYAQKGGLMAVNSSKPRLKIPLTDRMVLRGALRHGQVRYLNFLESLRIR